MRLIRAALLIAPLLFAAPRADAHGTGYRVVDPGAVVEFAYADGTPMAFATTQLFAPGEDAVPRLTGRTDRIGRVSWKPDRDGPWRVEVKDEEGHIVRAVVEIAAGRGVAGSASLPVWLGALSLAFNAIAAAFLVQRLLDRRGVARPAGPPHSARVT